MRPIPPSPLSAPSSRMSAVFDIDGTLANVKHRLHLLQSRPKNWDAFFDLAHWDTQFPQGRCKIQEAIEANLKVVYLTGRPEKTRQATVEWLSKHQFPLACNSNLFMRPQGDFRPASFVKVELLQRARDLVGDVHVIYDDDEAVVRSLRRAGYNCIHVAWMETSEAEAGALSEAQESADSGSRT